MTANGTPRLHVERILNHTIDDVAEIYDRHDYMREKRAGLEVLERAIWATLKGNSSVHSPSSRRPSL
jgi:hypothetical protein